MFLTISSVKKLPNLHCFPLLAYKRGSPTNRKTLRFISFLVAITQKKWYSREPHNAPTLLNIFLILFLYEKVYPTKGFKGQGNAPYQLRAEKVLGAERKKRAVAKIATTLLFRGAARGI